jgi:hypothetical protein
MKNKKLEVWFKLDDIIKSIANGQCLICETDLNNDLGTRQWNIPLCKKHRAEYLDQDEH